MEFIIRRYFFQLIFQNFPKISSKNACKYQKKKGWAGRKPSTILYSAIKYLWNWQEMKRICYLRIKKIMLLSQIRQRLRQIGAWKNRKNLLWLSKHQKTFRLTRQKEEKKSVWLQKESGLLRQGQTFLICDLRSRWFRKERKSKTTVQQ